MSTEQTATEPVVDQTSEAAPETADSNPIETPEAKSTEQPSAAPDTKPAEQASEPAPTDDDAKPAETAEAAPEDKPADRIVPDARDYTLPEGVPEFLGQFANENDMTQAQLDATLQQFGNITEQAELGRQNQIAELGQKHVDTWGKQKEYNLSIVRRALSQNDADGKFKALLDETGYGNHPVILDFFLSIGSSMKEGGFLKGANNTQSKAGLSAAQSMFGANHPSSN